MKLVWTTDIHLDSAGTKARNRFLEAINKQDPDKVLITGDIATGTTLIEELEWLEKSIHAPIHFVLGNHDYYESSISHVRSTLRSWLAKHSNSTQLSWLDIEGAIPLTDTCALIGQGGWGDARNGDFLETPIRINDHRLIKELTGLERPILQQKLQQLGTEAALELKRKLESITISKTDTEEIIVATHVPPFPEAAWYMGYSGAVDWIPDFTCKAIGDVLLSFAALNPAIQCTVLCGHGHHPGIVDMRENLRIHTGPAEYGKPTIAKEIFRF